MLVVKSKVRQIITDHSKRMSAKAWIALDYKVRKIVLDAIKTSGSHKTITDVEFNVNVNMIVT